MEMEKYLSHELCGLLIIGCLALVSISPSIHFFIYGYVPDFRLRESGLYETIGAGACLVAAMLNLRSFVLLVRCRSYSNSLWFVSLAIICLFISGEEVSWGQHFFNFKLSDGVAATNFQKEFNLHNSALIQSSNNQLSSVFFKLLMLYFIFLPMFLVAFPSLDRWVRRIMMPVPSMRIAIVALIAKSGDFVNYKVIYGVSFESDHLHLGEGVESIFEICFLILSFELFFYIRNKVREVG